MAIRPNPSASPPPVAQIDRILVNRFARGNGTVFVGAGVSLASSVPAWKALIAPLRENLGAGLEHLDPLQIAELYEVKNGRAALVQHLQDQLGKSSLQSNRLHELIVTLPVQRIFTTNFDEFLEQASKSRHIDRHVISHASQAGLSDASKLSIIKLHGDVSHTDAIVITARDFYSYAARNPTVADMLKVELQTRTVLFIGYSFSDPNLSMILSSASVQSGATPPAIYSIQFKPSELAVQAMKKRGVTVISLDAEPGTDNARRLLEAWLQEFNRLVNSFERRKKPRNLARFPGDFPRTGRRRSVKCEQVFQRLLDGLSSAFGVIVVCGEAGVGKTQLVMDAARDRLRPNDRALLSGGFEQVIWIHRIIRDNGRGHTLESIFSAIFSQVDVVFSAEDTDPNRSREKIAAILREQHLLVVIEDLDDPRSAPLRTPHAPVIDDFNRVRSWLQDIGANANWNSRIVVTSRNATLSGFTMDVPRLEPDDAIKMIHDDAHSLMLRRNFELTDAVVSSIDALTLGNPQAIRLALGLINSMRNADWLPTANTRSPRGGPIESVIDQLLEQIWNGLKNPAACAVVKTMVALPGEEWIPSMLLGGAQDGEAGRLNREAIRDCVGSGLLDYDAIHDSYFMHRTIKEGLCRHNWFDDHGELDLARNAFANRLLAFLRQDHVACRADIKEPYWNALVRDEMTKVDNYWRIIESMMWWAESRPLIVDFVLLLSHYMDSRFLNGLRVHFVKKALDMLEQGNIAMPADHIIRMRALLHIDTLGWTYMEDGFDTEALREIDQGTTLLENEGHEDLRALAWAWKARISANSGQRDALELIERARTCARACPEKHWIQARVSMISGDVQLMTDDTDGAEKSYLDAEASEERYGGEVGYQTDPRIGLALLRRAEQRPEQARDAIARARDRFVRLAENPHVLTGRLYGEYGLALITARQDSTREALPQLQKILKEIAARHGENNILLQLAKDEYMRLEHGLEGGDPPGAPAVLRTRSGPTA